MRARTNKLVLAILKNKTEIIVMIREVIHTVSDLVKSKRLNFIILMIVIALSVLFESFGFALIIPLMESLLDSDSESAVGEMFSNIFSLMNVEMTVMNTSIVFVSVIGIKNLLIILRGYLRSNFSYGLKFQAMKQITQAYFNMPLGQFIKYKHGDLVNNAITETQNTAMGILQLTEMITGLLLIPAFVVLMLMSSIELSLAMMVLGLVMYLVVSKFVGGYARRVGKEEITLNQSIASQVSENLSAMRSIRILGISRSLHTRLSVTLDDIKKLLVRWDTFSVSTSPIAEVLLVFVIVGYIIYISLNFDAGYFAKVLPILSMMVIVAYKTMTQLSRLLVNRMAVERYLPSMKLVNEMMKDAAVSNSENGTTKHCATKVEDIAFRGVTFAYEQGKDILKDVSFNIPMGKTTVIMGPSGSGKSTIIDLLLGLYEPSNGKIKIGSSHLQDLNIDSWREKIGYVGQDVFLFHASIEENIRIGHPEISSDQVREATKKVGLDQFIMELPDGYDTEVGDRGIMLSGGQRQRISIARALLKQPDILILDEATSALDDETALRLNKNIFSLMEDKTVFVVSHKQDVLKYADGVLHIKNGVLIEK